MINSNQFDLTIPSSVEALSRLGPDWVDDTGGRAGLDWTYDGTTFHDAVREGVTSDALYVTIDEFIDLFTPEEWEAIKDFKNQRPSTGKSRALQREWDRLKNKENRQVNLKSPRWAVMGPHLISTGLIADQARLDHILSGQPPP